MSTFSLIRDDLTYLFDVRGDVSHDDQIYGQWSTDGENRLVVSQDGQRSLVFDVGWRFNEKNHLVLTDNGEDVFDFNKVAGLRPLYFTHNAALKVRPDRNFAFEFALHGEWDLNDEHDLSFSINDVTSVIDGYVDNSNKSRFTYLFVNKENPFQLSKLGFAGEWSLRNDEGVPRLNFSYAREAGTTDLFALPEALAIDTTINQFVYQYDKKNRTRRIVLVGAMNVSPDFRITYTLDRQESAGEEVVKQSVFAIDAEFNRDSFSGDMALLVKKADGSSGSFELNITGDFTAALGSTQLQAAFMYSYVRDGNVTDHTFGFEGALQLSNDGLITWEFTANATQMSVTVSAEEIKIGNARIDARLNITAANGHIVGVNAFLGVAF